MGNVRATIRNGATGLELAGYTDYFPSGLPIPERDQNADYRFGYQGQFAEKEDATGWSSFELRSYDPTIARWMTIDPYEQYWSPYLGMGNDWVNGVDPDGGFVESTHTDKYGNVLAVYNDDNNSVYRHNDIESIDSWNGSLLNVNMDQKNVTRMGETPIWDSFYDHRSGGGYGKIDFGSYDAANELIKFEGEIGQIYNNNDQFTTLSLYMKNGGTWGFFDYKSEGGSKKMSDLQLLNHRYRGSQISKGIYVSARDVGNFEAGFVAGLVGTSKIAAMKMMGAFNANGNKMNSDLLKQLNRNWTAPYGETSNSHKMQSKGYDYGSQRRYKFHQKYGW